MSSLSFSGLVKHYGSANHHDYRECMTAKAKLGQIIKSMTSRLTASVSVWVCVACKEIMNNLLHHY